MISNYDQGNFVGMSGVDMNPDKYQASAKNMVYIVATAFILAVGRFISG